MADDLEGSTIAGGALSRARFAKALGVSVLARRGFEVIAVAWCGEHLEVEIEQPEEGRALFLVERYQRGRPGFLRCGELSLAFRGSETLHPTLEAVLRRVAPRALAKTTIEELAAIVAADPDAGRPREPLPMIPVTDQERFEGGSFLTSWGSAAVRAQFFAVAEISRAQLDSLDYFNQGLFVQHCDSECNFLTPQTGVPMMPLALYPWEDRIRRVDWGRSGRRREPDPLSFRLITTELDERDVILGKSLAKLDAALKALPVSEPEHSMIFCSSTCVPVVAGEDTESVVSSHRTRLEPLPLLHLTTTPHSMQMLLRQLLVERRRRAEGSEEKGNSASINLIGFSEDPALEELTELLQILGVEVNVAIIPTLDTSLLDRLPRAACNVLHPNELWQGHYDQLLFDSSIPTIAPPAPYGLKRTAQWLEEVVGALCLKVDVEKTLEKELLAARRSWRELSRRAGRHRAAFVIRADESHLLTHPEKCGGIPLVEMLREMDFQVHVLVHAHRGFGEIDEIRSTLDGMGASLVTEFKEPEQLPSLFRDSELSVVYSEHFYDGRLTRAGLSGFSGQYFERGLAGGLRTLRRLVELCELPFFVRYGRFIER